MKSGGEWRAICTTAQGQIVTALDLELGSLSEEIRRNAPHLGKKVESFQKLVQHLHREIRTTSYLLHPPLLDEAGLNSALSWYVQGVSQRSGIEIQLDVAEGFRTVAAGSGTRNLQGGAGVVDEHPQAFGK